MNIEQIIKTDTQLPDSRKLIINLIYTSNWISDQTVDVLKPFSLSIPQFNVLRILRGQKGKPANLSTIQERMVSKMSNTTRLVDKLIGKGFVERFVCEENRRKVEINITNKGLELLKELDPIMVAHEEKVTERLSSTEVTQLIELLNKLRD